MQKQEAQKQKLIEILENLSILDEDAEMPKNARIKVKRAMEILANESELDINLKIDQSLQELSEIAESPDIPQHARMQIWSVVSLLESD